MMFLFHRMRNQNQFFLCSMEQQTKKHHKTTIVVGKNTKGQSCKICKLTSNNPKYIYGYYSSNYNSKKFLRYTCYNKSPTNNTTLSGSAKSATIVTTQLRKSYSSNVAIEGAAPCGSTQHYHLNQLLKIIKNTKVKTKNKTKKE